jgi:yeast amino acid transporter
MITISGVLGSGFFVYGCSILQSGGPLALILSFALVGFLTWAVMQCIGEMFCTWPIFGTFTKYVSEFVDKKLGIAVGVAYWYVPRYMNS